MLIPWYLYSKLYLNILPTTVLTGIIGIKTLRFRFICYRHRSAAWTVCGLLPSNWLRVPPEPNPIRPDPCGHFYGALEQAWRSWAWHCLAVNTRHHSPRLASAVAATTREPSLGTCPRQHGELSATNFSALTAIAGDHGSGIRTPTSTNTLLRVAIENRSSGINKNQCIYLIVLQSVTTFFPTPYLLSPPVFTNSTLTIKNTW